MNRKFLILLCLPFVAWAKPAKAIKAVKSPTKEVDSVFASYRGGKPVKASIHKTVVQEALGTSMKSEGTFYFSKGKMRMEMREPEHTTLVYDGKNIWFEERADEEHVVVRKMRAQELRKSNSLLAALFDRGDALKAFNLKSKSAVGAKKVFVFEPKDKKNEVKSLEIALKDKDVLSISYTDEMNNKVTLEFEDLSRAAVPAEKFAYKPPKGADVNEM